MMIIKCGRREFDLNEKDIIFDNGACYQITSQTYREGFAEYYPVIAEAKAKKMIKEGYLILIKEEMSHITKDGKEVFHKYYKINEEVK